MYKIIALLFSLIFTCSVVNAESISRTVNSLGINKSAISISIKNIETGNKVYELNEKMPMMPASTLKIITSSASVDTLGSDYKFSTKLYKSTNNDLYLKLSGDPLLTTGDLGVIIDGAKEKNITPKSIYVDDSVFDSVEWGEGWQWDDDLNPLMQKFSAYNINGNLVKIELSPTENHVAPNIKVKPFYPLTFMNLVMTDFKMPNSVKLEKANSLAPNMLKLSGYMSKIYTTSIPVMNPKMNFVLRLEEVIRDKKFEYFDAIKFAKLPDKNVYLVSQADHGLDEILPEILKTSSNLAAESLFKKAGAVWANSKGSSENSIKMLNAYLEKLNLNTSDIKIVDGSGVSKNNIVTSDFMTEFLVIKSKDANFEDYKNTYPAPGSGTLKNRMLYFKNNLRAKTGTLSDTSAIAGYIVSRSGKTYAFDIMINDAKTSAADKKNIEEQILRNIYANY